MNPCSVIFAILLIVNVYELKLINKEFASNEVSLEDTKAIEDIVGGISECNPNDSQYLRLAEESLGKYLQDSGLKESYRVVKVNRVTEQVVEGTLTKIQFVAGQCAASCDVISNNIQCNSEVWDRPWMNSKIIEVRCW